MLGINTPALPASLRRTNERTVISLLFRLGQASRADLAKAAGISQPTAGKIISDLLAKGIIEEARDSEGGASSANRLGRPGQLLRLDTKTLRFLAVELGVRQTCVAALPVGAGLEDRWTWRFRTPTRAEAWLAELGKIGSKLPARSLWGTLLSVPGIVDEEKASVLFSPNLHWLEKAELPAMMKEAFPAPILLVQEIRALALGQMTAEPGGEDFLLVDFGQGVGGAVVLDGQLHAGAIPLSAEVGHTPVEGNQRKCGCGGRGCLETLASEQGLVKSWNEAHTRKVRSWPELRKLLWMAKLDASLKSILEPVARVVAGALNVLGIRRVVITGALAELPTDSTEFLANAIRSGSLWGRFGEVQVSFAPHRRAAGLVAAGIDRLLLPEVDTSNARNQNIK